MGDFGLSRTARADGNQGLGAIRAERANFYLSPEVLAGGDYRAPADVYALGCMLWEAGRQELAWAQYRRQCALAWQLNCAVSQAVVDRGERLETPACPPGAAGAAEFDRLVERMLHRDPAARPLMTDVVRRLCEVHKAAEKAVAQAQAQAQLRETEAVAGAEAGLATRGLEGAAEPAGAAAGADESGRRRFLAASWGDVRHWVGQVATLVAALLCAACMRQLTPGQGGLLFAGTAAAAAAEAAARERASAAAAAARESRGVGASTALRWWRMAAQ